MTHYHLRCLHFGCGEPLQCSLRCATPRSETARAAERTDTEEKQRPRGARAKNGGRNK